MNEDKHPVAALAMLIVLQVIMLAALFAKVPPHPPTVIPISGIGPLVGVSIGVALAAMLVGPNEGWVGKVLSGVAVLLALISYGPQKYIDPQFPLIWPAVVAAQIAAITILWSLFRSKSARA
ncbi:hypothetical protein [Maritalea sp.]|uniref:hypothetical protein n=1 Tax=Maritalea sp. TaxID=2003361 RepID=UPI003EF0F158